MHACSTHVWPQSQSHVCVHSGKHAHLYGTPDQHLEHTDLYERLADTFSLSDDGSPEHSPQISPASVLPTPVTQPLKVGQVKEHGRTHKVQWERRQS